MNIDGMKNGKTRRRNHQSTHQGELIKHTRMSRFDILNLEVEEVLEDEHTLR